MDKIYDICCGIDVHKKLIVAHNLKATKEQIVDDLNGVMSSLQRWMMEKVLRHLGELNVHVKELDHAIDDFIMPKENGHPRRFRM